MIGLPGTGIGGIFYGLLIGWIVLREGWFSLRGKSSLQRWVAIRAFSMLLLLIVAMLCVQAIVLIWVIESGSLAQLLEGGSKAAGLLKPDLNFGSVLVVFGIVAGIQVLRSVLSYLRAS